MKKYYSLLLLSVSVSLLQSCKESKHAATNKVYKQQVKEYAKILREYPVRDSAGLNYGTDWAGTTNFSMRKPNYVIIHHTAQNGEDETIRTFTLPRTQVSAHYVVSRDGTVHHMLNDLLRAHHAGVGRWGSITDMNSCSIGIELDNNGSEPFSDALMNSLVQLLDRLKKAYSIPASNFIGHLDWAPGRKVDPSRYFNWQLLAAKGFGHWYDTTGITVPADFNAVNGLKMIGYNTAKPEIAIQSYKIHFVPKDSSKVLNEADRKIIYSLLSKYQ